MNYIQLQLSNLGEYPFDYFNLLSPGLLCRLRHTRYLPTRIGLKSVSRLQQCCILRKFLIIRVPLQFFPSFTSASAEWNIIPLTLINSLRWCSSLSTGGCFSPSGLPLRNKSRATLRFVLLQGVDTYILSNARLYTVLASAGFCFRLAFASLRISLLVETMLVKFKGRVEVQGAESRQVTRVHCRESLLRF